MSKVATDLVRFDKFPWFTKEELKNTPSIRDGYTIEKERQARRNGIQILTSLAKKCQLPQSVIGTAAYYFHIFYLRYSFQKYEGKKIALASIFLAAKVEENRRTLTQMLEQYYLVINDGQPGPDKKTPVFQRQRTEICSLELILLKAIDFQFNIKSPYKSLMDVIDAVYPNTTEDWRKKRGVKGTGSLGMIAWYFINDALRSSLCLYYDPKTIAIAAFYMSFFFKSKSQPKFGNDGKYWYEVLWNLTEDEMEYIGNSLLEEAYDKASREKFKKADSNKKLNNNPKNNNDQIHNVNNNNNNNNNNDININNNKKKNKRARDEKKSHHSKDQKKKKLKTNATVQILPCPRCKNKFDKIGYDNHRDACKTWYKREKAKDEKNKSKLPVSEKVPIFKSIVEDVNNNK